MSFVSCSTTHRSRGGDCRSLSMRILIGRREQLKRRIHWQHVLVHTQTRRLRATEKWPNAGKFLSSVQPNRSRIKNIESCSILLFQENEGVCGISRCIIPGSVAFQSPARQVLCPNASVPGHFDCFSNWVQRDSPDTQERRRKAWFSLFSLIAQNSYRIPFSSSCSWCEHTIFRTKEILGSGSDLMRLIVTNGSVTQIHWIFLSWDCKEIQDNAQNDTRHLLHTNWWFGAKFDLPVFFRKNIEGPIHHDIMKESSTWCLGYFLQSAEWWTKTVSLDVKPAIFSGQLPSNSHKAFCLCERKATRLLVKMKCGEAVLSAWPPEL